MLANEVLLVDSTETYLPQIVKRARHQKEQEVERHHCRGHDIDVGDPTGDGHTVRDTADRRRRRAEAIGAEAERREFGMQREVQGGREQECLECRFGYLRNPPVRGKIVITNRARRFLTLQLPSNYRGENGGEVIRPRRVRGVFARVEG